MPGKIFSIFQWEIIVLISVAFNAYSEGSKELNSNFVLSTTLYMCNDYAGHCNNTGGIRSEFATYDASRSAPENDRLYFVMLANEVVYMGFNGNPSGGNPQPKIVYRICDNTGNVVYPESDLPTSDNYIGFIPSLLQDYYGPDQLLPPPPNQGYTALEWTPPAAGTYYIEFSQKNTNGFVYGVFLMNLLDITIYNTATSTIKPGRLYSKSWQLSETNDFTGINYILSDDSIITSVEFNSMRGGAWIQYANRTGCGNTNWAVDRNSLFNQQALFPQYKLFLNCPDTDVFPVSKNLGKIIRPDPYGNRNCDGSIDFIVNVDKAGYLEMDLSFIPASYRSLTLSQDVIRGSNTIHWNGKDGNGAEVANNVAVSFTIKYINGLTNLPLYDVEGNSNGMRVTLIAPAGIQPRVYWDDVNIWTGSCAGCPAGSGPNSLDGQANALSGGCIVPFVFPPGCHKWPYSGGGWGNLNTINSWWYAVSSSQTYPDIAEWRNPDTLVFASLPQTICSGSSGVLISVNADPNTDFYHWGYTGTGITFLPSNVTSTSSVTVNFSASATSGNITVYGTNLNCSHASPVISLPITITAGIVPPDLGSDRTICQGPGAFLDAGPGYNTYLWSTGDTIEKIIIRQAGKYWVRVGNPDCYARDTVNLGLFPVNPVSLKPDTAICQGETYVLNPGKDFSTVSWSTGESTPTIRISSGGIYWAHTIDNNNCPGADTVKISMKPAIQLNLVRDTNLCSAKSIVLHATFPGAAYRWQDGTQDSLYTIMQPGIYWVRVSKDSCAVLDTSVVHNCSGVYFPTAFYPGSLIGNNYFHPIGAVMSKFTLTIFNRFGQQIFTTNDQETGWDGTCRGQLCPADVYAYTISYELSDQPGTTVKAQGTVMLMR